MELIRAITENITRATDIPFQADRQQPISGGSINTAFRLDSGACRYFIKTNAASLLDMFIAEAAGLWAMTDTGTINVPRPVCYGEAGGHSYLVLEYITLTRQGNAAKFGEKLAAMHGHTNETFGFRIDNTIGSTPQQNNSDKNWARFWQNRRLGYQLRLAKQNGCGSRLIDRGNELMEAMPRFFSAYQPQASLLHGDLWAGNWSFDDHGEPVIYDPATYYGDREADIAMTELFGAPGTEFYDAYNSVWPLNEGYPVRKTLYNLYHILNHYNLFGGSYLRQAESMTEKLLSEI